MAEINYSRIRFILSAPRVGSLPRDEGMEIAFAGRSNAGKSSALNAVAGRKNLAKTSAQPGKTQHINLFDVQPGFRFADLPGYGYARAAKTEIKGWTRLIHAYLKGRVALRRLCLLVDGRHGLKTVDEDLMALLDTAAVPYRVVLTKCDKVRAAELAAREEEIRKALVSHPAALPDLLASSAVKKTGLEVLRADLAALASAQRIG